VYPALEGQANLLAELFEQQLRGACESSRGKENIYSKETTMGHIILHNKASEKH
jgi:hypothetical protein